MINLTSITDIVNVITSAAATVDVHCSWADLLSSAVTPGRTNTAITTATTTTVLASPAASTQRNVKGLYIRNKHASLSCDITVQHYDGTTTVQIWFGTLAAGECVDYDGEKFVKFSAAGIPQTVYVGPSGTVTSLTVASSNGFAGSFTPTTTPVLTMQTSITGILKGNGTAVSAAVSGTDYLVTNQTITLSGEASGSGTTAITVTLSNAAVIGKVLTGYASGAGTVAAADTILQAIQKLDGNIALKAPIASPVFTGVVTLPTPFTLGATSVTTTGVQFNFLNAATGTTGTTSGKVVFDTSPTIVNPTIAALANLTTNGLVKTSGGVGTLGIAVAGTDYQAPITISSTILDFGTGKDTVSAVVTSLTGITASSNVVGGVCWDTTLSRAVEELSIDPISVAFQAGAAQVTIFATAVLGTCTGKYKVSFMVI